MSTPKELPCDLNQSTQPTQDYPIFNNWNVVPKGWFVACRSKELKRGKVISKLMCGHKVAIFRSESGKVHALDAYCPHMGMDLGAGKVKGETIQCFFHHWKFDGQGKCVDIPCLAKIPAQRTSLNSYPTEEKYGFIWVYSDRVAPQGVIELDELKGKPLLATYLKPFRRIAHPHITMMNSIDEQHMRTVHKLDMSLELTTKESGTRFEVSFKGKAQSNTWVGKMQKFLLGDDWESRVIFSDGCIGILTTNMNAKLFNRIPLPRGQFIFSHPFTRRGETTVHSMIIAERKPGIFGFIYSWTLLQMQRAAMKFLAHQDGRIVYPMLRFNASGLIAGADTPSAKWISFVNRVIEPSLWSKPEAHTALKRRDQSNNNFSATSARVTTEESFKSPSLPPH